MNVTITRLLEALKKRLSERRAQLLHSYADRLAAAAELMSNPKMHTALMKRAQYWDREANALAHIKRAKKLKNGDSVK